MKNHGVSVLLTCLICSFVSNAFGLWEIPLPLTGRTQKLLIKNPSPDGQTIWILKPNTIEKAPEETSIDLLPFQKLEIDLSIYGEVPWIRIISESEVVSINHQVDNGPWILLKDGSSNEVVLKQGLPNSEIWVSNLTSLSQNFEIQGLANSNVYLRSSLEPFETKKLTWRELKNIRSASALKIVGELRLTALWRNSLAKTVAQFTPTVSSFKSPLISRFLVANSNLNQSFVIEISDPELLAQARWQIKNPQASVSRLLIAKVDRGHGNVNSDAISSLKAPWSWHVSEIYRFADFGSIDCDGNPLLLEQTLEWWLLAKDGHICFWDYKIKAEL